MFVPKSLIVALSHAGWQQAMEEEMLALALNGTWNLVPLPEGKRTVWRKWV